MSLRNDVPKTAKVYRVAEGTVGANVELLFAEHCRNSPLDKSAVVTLTAAVAVTDIENNTARQDEG